MFTYIFEISWLRTVWNHHIHTCMWCILFITGTTQLEPYFCVKPLEHIGRLGTRRFHRGVPDFEMSCSEVTTPRGYQDSGLSSGHQVACSNDNSPVVACMDAPHYCVCVGNTPITSGFLSKRLMMQTMFPCRDAIRPSIHSNSTVLQV